MSATHSPTTEPHPATHARTGRHEAANRVGHAVAAGINLVILYLVNVSPGWDALPFLTADTTRVLGIVNLSLWVSVAAEVSYVLIRSTTWRALGDTVTTAVGLAAIVRIWQVFPLDVSNGWEVFARVLLGIGIVGSVVGVVAALSRVIRSLVPSAPAT